MAKPIQNSNLLAERQHILREFVSVLESVLVEEDKLRSGRDLLRRNGITAEELARPKSGLTFAAYNRAMIELVDRGGIPALGLRTGGQKRSRALGVIGIGMVTGLDLAHTFRFAPWAVNVAWSGHLHFTLVREGRWAITRYQMDWDSVTPLGWTALEDCFLHCIGVIEEILPGLDWSRCEVRMRGPAPPHAALYPRFFPCKVLFMQTENELCLPIEWLDFHPMLTNFTVASYCEDLGRALGNEPARGLPLGARVRGVLDDLEQENRTTLQEVADRLEMTTRALQYGLAQEGSSFRDVLHCYRLVLARKYLRETSMPIKEIAFRLGFAQLPSFYRAFTRETGRTPDQYRGNGTVG